MSIDVPHHTNVQARSEEHTSELQSRSDLVCRLLLEKKKKYMTYIHRPGGNTPELSLAKLAPSKDLSWRSSRMFSRTVSPGLSLAGSIEAPLHSTVW